jgi:hypothetical protein
LTTIHWVFSGIGVLGLVLLGRLGVFLWKKRSGGAVQSSPAPSENPIATDNPAPQDTANFTRPTPDEMNKQVESLPPFQHETGWNAYHGLEVRWQALFQGIEEDTPTNDANPTAKKKWIVDLKH